MNKAEIGLLLARARKGAHLTQAELARVMGTTQPVVARAEAGNRMPTLPFIDRWARATGSHLRLTFGITRSRASNQARKRALVESAMGAVPFDPWERNPSRVEAATLEKAGLDRDYFRTLNKRRSSTKS